MVPEAIAAHEKGLALYPEQGFSWTLARTYALAGRSADARRIMASLEAGTSRDVAHPWFVAAAYTALDDHDKALDWLERAYDARILFLCNLARERAAGFDIARLRGQPRFQALLRRLNLAQG